MSYLNKEGVERLWQHTVARIDGKADATKVGSLEDLKTTDKSNLVNAVNEVVDNMTTGSGITIDNELLDNSTNPVQNKVITEALDKKLNNYGKRILDHSRAWGDGTDMPESLAWSVDSWDSVFYFEKTGYAYRFTVTYDYQDEDGNNYQEVIAEHVSGTGIDFSAGAYTLEDFVAIESIYGEPTEVYYGPDSEYQGPFYIATEECWDNTVYDYNRKITTEEVIKAVENTPNLASKYINMGMDYYDGATIIVDSIDTPIYMFLSGEFDGNSTVYAINLNGDRIGDAGLFDLSIDRNNPTAMTLRGYAEENGHLDLSDLINNYTAPYEVEISTDAGDLGEGYLYVYTKLPETIISQSDWNETNAAFDAYIQNKPAIKSGTGKYSIIEGNPGNIASGGYSHVEGSQTEALGEQSHAEGFDTKAKGEWSHAEGKYTQALGNCSHAEGSTTIAYGRSHAEGYESQATGDSSHAEGADTRATGWFGAHAEGGGSKAEGNASHAEGGHWKQFERDEETLEGTNVLISAGGLGTIASGNAAHAEGIGTTASSVAAHAQGFVTQATKFGAFSGGMASITKYSSTVTFTRTGRVGTFTLTPTSSEPSLGVGDYISLSTSDNTVSNLVYKIDSVNDNTYTINDTSSIVLNKTFNIAKLIPTKATGESAMAFGNECIASGQYSAAIGMKNQALFHTCFAEGCRNIAGGQGFYSCHAEGQDTQAIADVAHAEGKSTVASGKCSHVEGWGTVAQGYAQHVQGKWNIIDDAQVANSNTFSTYAHIVGNGTSNSARSNAHTLDWSGNAWYAGSIAFTGNHTNANGSTSTGKTITLNKTRTLTINYEDNTSETIIIPVAEVN